jgi:DNA repair exonuclease SbcCD ATPase subunit
MGVSPHVDPIRPDDLDTSTLPTAMRGYDKGAVERLLARAADGLAQVVRERDRLRGLVDDVNGRADAAEGEARVIAGQLVDLSQRLSAAEEERDAARTRLAELEESLARAESEHGAAVDRLREAHEEADRLKAHIGALEAAGRGAPAAPVVPPPSDAAAAEILVAAVRTAGEIRASARDAAQRVLRKSRGRAAQAESTAERQLQLAAEAREREAKARAAVEEQRAALAAAVAARDAAEREAEQIRARARAEAAATLGSVVEERERMRALLAGTLEALGTVDGGDIVSDLSDRIADVQGDGAGQTSEAAPG